MCSLGRAVPLCAVYLYRKVFTASVCRGGAFSVCHVIIMCAFRFVKSFLSLPVIVTVVEVVCYLVIFSVQYFVLALFSVVNW